MDKTNVLNALNDLRTKMKSDDHFSRFQVLFEILERSVNQLPNEPVSDGDVYWVGVERQHRVTFVPPMPLELAESIPLSASMQLIIPDVTQRLTELLESIDSNQATGEVSTYLLTLILEAESLKEAVDAEIGMYITGAVVTANAQNPPQVKATFRNRALNWLADWRDGVR